MMISGPNGLKVASCPAQVAGIDVPGADACTYSTSGAAQGDSGGPNVIKANGGDLLVSITSWGDGPRSENPKPWPSGKSYTSLSLRTGSVCDYIKNTSGVLPAGSVSITVYNIEDAQFNLR